MDMLAEKLNIDSLESADESLKPGQTQVRNAVDQWNSPNL
jgi:hypothetical protein